MRLVFDMRNFLNDLAGLTIIFGSTYAALTVQWWVPWLITKFN